MINTYIKLCHTYYVDWITGKLLNDGTQNKDGSSCRRPQHSPSFPAAVVLSNYFYGTMLTLSKGMEPGRHRVLSIARRLPLFCAMLMDKGASLGSVTVDDSTITIVHVLASSEVFSITREDELLYKVFGCPHGQVFPSPIALTGAAFCLLFDLLYPGALGYFFQAQRQLGQDGPARRNRVQELVDRGLSGQSCKNPHSRII
jgi:hypothetical protein